MCLFYPIVYVCMYIFVSIYMSVYMSNPGILEHLVVIFGFLEGQTVWFLCLNFYCSLLSISDICIRKEVIFYVQFFYLY